MRDLGYRIYSPLRFLPERRSVANGSPVTENGQFEAEWNVCCSRSFYDNLAPYMATYETMEELSLGHAQLGRINGIARGDGVVQFRGIPFADIPARFRQAMLRTTLPETPFDATCPGPACPQPDGVTPVPQYFDGPLAEDSICLPESESDEFKCLNLNITAHRAYLTSHGAAVPVLVYIHGGGLTNGSSSIQVSGRELYDPSRWVRHVHSKGKALVIVTINYRVGPLGFMASRQLAAYNESFHEPVGNYGLHDQRRALEWIFRFIGGFGGDAKNITVMGGSAGAASAHFQALFPETLVNRAILSSGTILTLGAMPQDFHQCIFDRYVQSLGAEHVSVEELQKVPVHSLIGCQTASLWRPVIDLDWVPGRNMNAYMPDKCSKVDLLIGSCDFEKDMYLAMFSGLETMTSRNDESIQAATSELFKTSALTTDPSILSDPGLLSLYSIKEREIEHPSRNSEAWAEYCADLTFRIPPLAAATHQANAKTYVFNFSAPSPYPGWKLGYGKAHHACTDLFLFDPAGDLVESKLRAGYYGAVEQIRQIVSDFCYGESNLEPFRHEDGDGLGPICSIENHGTVRSYQTLRDLLGDIVEMRWKGVLRAVKK